MIITLFPSRSDHPMTLVRTGSHLVINGVPTDLEDYTEGDSQAVIGQPVHDGTRWRVNLVLPHGARTPSETLFPAQIVLEGDGPVVLPPYEVVVHEEMP